MACVYKLIREDGLAYIGIAEDFQQRIREHAKSLRFSQSKIAAQEILFEGDWQECNRLEESFISKHDTYNNGLNCTPAGKGRSETAKFNTKGFVFSEQSRQRMSESAKARGSNNTGYKHSTKTKEKWSQLRRGKAWCPIKIDPVVLKEKYMATSFSDDIMKQYAKKSQQDSSYNGPWTAPNGKPLTKKVVFSKVMAADFNCTPEGLQRALRSIDD